MLTIKQIKVTEENLMRVMTSGKYYKLHKGTIADYFLMRVEDMKVSDVLDKNATIVMIDEE